MTKERIIVLGGILTCIGVLLAGLYMGTPLRRYRPDNPDEADIQNLIFRLEKASASRDLGAYLACLSPGGRFMAAGTEMRTRDALKKELPAFWADLDRGTLIRVSSRESLNGDILDGEYYDPRFKIEGDHARVIVSFVTRRSRWRTTVFFQCRKRAGRWLITRLEWDMG
ncbi:MAG TPA: hypothetical protein DHV36_15160 [Desulfobacteraceae bacterium]|nr:hypothetical protein [Desulfobacteraceae bacterium]|tara:strand:+ start:206 stop:712 length:507 start_codon:yes stop_codon:yes gene_type:complete